MEFSVSIHIYVYCRRTFTENSLQTRADSASESVLEFTSFQNGKKCRAELTCSYASGGEMNICDIFCEPERYHIELKGTTRSEDERTRRCYTRRNI